MSGHSGAVHDVNTHANFCEDWLRGFGAAKGRILAFSIDLLRRLYNVLALPCECVTVMYLTILIVHGLHGLIAVFYYLMHWLNVD